MFILLCIINYTARAQVAGDTIHLFFDFNNPKLNTSSRNQLDSLLYNDVITKSSNVTIIGYADYVGTDLYNKTLSEQRATAVAAYLTGMGLDTAHIQLCIGKGEVQREMSGTKGYAPDRKVDIVLITVKSKNIAKATSETKSKIVALPAFFPNIDTIPIGRTFVLRNILFYQGRHSVIPSSLPVLQSLVDFMRRYPAVKIRIEGHICCLKTGRDALDEDVSPRSVHIDENPDGYALFTLSVNRARYIYEFLVKNGIATDRLKYGGYGRSMPLVEPERTLDDEAQNRRVEIRILAK